jgi:ribosomal 50S subunit-recycling heat shock protein
VRLDLFLKTSRLVKRRTVARELIDAGRVRVNGAEAKPAKEVRPGDRITLVFSSRTLELEVLFLPVPKRTMSDDVYRIVSDIRNERQHELWIEDQSSS